MNKRMSVVIPLLLALVAALALPGSAVTAQDVGEVIVDGLNAPQGVLVAPDGSIYVVDSGVGGDTEVEAVSPEGELITATVGDTSQIVRVEPDGTQTVVAMLPSILLGDEAVGGAKLAMLDGELYVTSGAYIEAGPDTPEPAPNTAAVLRVGEDGTLEEVAPTWRVEMRMNPDGTIIESHPYGIAAGPDGKLWVADAGGNTLLRIDPTTSSVEVLTVFQALPGVFPNPLRDGEMLTDPVPTGVTFDDDGNAIVSLLSGAPFVPGSTKVMKVGNMGATSEYATGLTMLTDIARGPDGEFYGVQFAVFTDQGPTPNSGAIVRIVEGEGSEPVLEGLSFPTSVAFNEAGDAYIAINGAGPPGAGAVIMVEGLASGEMAEAAATPEPAEEAAEEAATPEPTEEPAEEATPEPTEEPAEEEDGGDAGPAAETEAAEEEMALMDVVDTAAGNNDFSTLVAAIQAAGLVDALKSEGPFTVFAPTNAAFEALPAGTLEALLSDPAGDLTDILLYHVVPGEALAADISDGLEVTSLQGDTLTFSVDGDTVMVNDATILATDIEASNGVIHVIDSVLLPGGEEEMGEVAGAGEAATPEATEEPAEEATPEATEEPAEEATPEATEEPAEEVTPEATEEPAEEAATPEATEEMAEEEAGAPETLPDTGAEQPGTLPIVLIVMGVIVALAGGVFMRRRIA